MSIKQYSQVVFIIVATALGAFYSGFFLKNIIAKNNAANSIQVSNPSLLPYFSDEIIIMTKTAPRYTLMATASRYSKDNQSYNQRQKIFFFNGEEWQTTASNTSSDNLEIAPTPAIPNWEITIDPSLVLKQKVKGKVQINNNKISFEAPLLANELGIRSLANYTIFKSEAPGKLIINNQEYESYVLYSRTYSYNASIGLIATTNPIGINTNWIAFWDLDGNFYNIDETMVNNETAGQYKSHSIAILKDSDGRVQKSFTLDLQKNADSGYSINIFDKINRSIDVNFLNAISVNSANKTINNKLGQISGEVTLKNGKKVKGFGIYEYIYQ